MPLVLSIATPQTAASLAAVPPLTWLLGHKPGRPAADPGSLGSLLHDCQCRGHRRVLGRGRHGGLRCGESDHSVGLGKGAWVGLWILYVIWPALLMHHFATWVGMASLGRALSTVLPRRSENILLLAWVLPSFIQGVSGFGTPIAVAAPLLVALVVGKARSVALPLIGYHWAVGFGSMGSSFYMGALTAHLDATGTAESAQSASIALGLNCILAGVLVALMSDGWSGLREGWRMIAVAGPVMAIV